MTSRRCHLWLQKVTRKITTRHLWFMTSVNSFLINFITRIIYVSYCLIKTKNKNRPAQTQCISYTLHGFLSPMWQTVSTISLHPGVHNHYSLSQGACFCVCMNCSVVLHYFFIHFFHMFTCGVYSWKRSYENQYALLFNGKRECSFEESTGKVLNCLSKFGWWVHPQQIISWSHC